MDLTFLIDDNYNSPSTRSYAHEIPDDGTAYKLFPDKIHADILKQCPCSIQCGDNLVKEPNIIKRIQHTRSDYHGLPQGSRRTSKIIMLIRSSLIINNKGRKFHNFEGTTICMQKWTDIFGISKATYYRALKYIKDNVYSVEKIRKPPCSNVRGLDACGFIAHCLQKYGDHSPEREKLLLPPCITKRFIYEEYLENHGPHIKIKHFYYLFNREYGKTVSFAKNGNINPCDICLKANNELHKLQDDWQKQQLKRDLQIHLDRQSIERQDYYRKKKEAHVRPNEVVSIIIDGMDQGKTSIPHFRGWCRAKSAAPAIKTHITGAMVHGKKNFFFLDVLQWPHDPNLTLTCLLNALCGACVDSFPARLYLQCDNCGRENKNKFVIGFLAFLCYSGYLREVYLSFLVKGHTHEDIDQQFSKISHYLRTINAMTLPQLGEAINGSFSQKQNQMVEILGKVFDIKGWISDSLNDIHNHSFPHQFWIFCDRPNHVALKTRMWSTDIWVPAPDAQHLEIFKLDVQGNQVLPQGVPDLCLPNYEKLNLQHAKAVIEKSKIHLSFEEYNWWTDFINNPKTVENNSRDWPLQSIQKKHKLVDYLVEENSSHNENSNTCITSLLNAEQTYKEVVTMQRKRKL